MMDVASVSAIRKMVAGPDFDEMIARKVFGRVVARGEAVPRFSTDILSAWDVVEKLRKHRGTRYGEPGGYFFLEDDSENWPGGKGSAFNCSFLASPRDDEAADDEVAEAPTAPLAICRAALLCMRQGAADSAS
jgi:hypothetical protein